MTEERTERPLWMVGNRPPLDMKRVGRAVDLAVENVGEGEYRVWSSRNEYYVALLPHYDCPCGDFVWRNELCKHIIAALLFHGDEEAQSLAEQIIGTG